MSKQLKGYSLLKIYLILSASQHYQRTLVS